ncbi:MAG: FG-GAP-like repeat-containing protein [Pyrinomonadaceae bacterium]
MVPRAETFELKDFGSEYEAHEYFNSVKNLHERSFQLRSSTAPAVTPEVGEVDPLFNPLMDSTSSAGRATALQPDGKILVGGVFRTLNGARFGNIARLNADYSVDSSFTAGTNGAVGAIALQPDGKIIIGGAFTAVNGVGQNFLARLMPNGSIDPTFNTSGGASSLINDVAVLPDGKIMVGGAFVFVAGAVSPYVARLNPNGSRDSSFNSNLPLPGPPSFVPTSVNSLAPLADGKVIIAGFVNKSVNPSPSTSAIARLNADGTLDGTFVTSQISSNALKTVVQPDGKILLAGFFTTYGTTSRSRIMRLEANGALDTTFDPGTGFDGPVFTISRRADGTILAGGIFSIFNGTLRNDVALLKNDGSLDTSFVSSVFSGGIINTLLTGADGRTLIGGGVTFPSVARDTFALLGPTGTLDTSFTLNATAPGGTRAIAIQPDGKMLVAGLFSRVNGTARPRLVRFNVDGTVDGGFNTSTANLNVVTNLMIQPDGKVLVGGAGLSQNTGSPGPSVALIRLNANGSYDTTFTPGVPARTAGAIALQPDGKIIFSYAIAVVGGTFTGDTSRLNLDGSLDASFDGLPLTFETMVVQPNGTILAGGPVGLTYVGGGPPETHNGILRMNADGSHDRTFRSGFISNENGAGFTAVYDIERQPDGRILVGGTLYTGASTSPVAIARLDTMGSVDGSFALNTVSSPYEFPRAEAIQTLPNGKIMVAGLFDHIGLLSQNNVARLNANGGVDPAFVTNTDGTAYDVAVDGTGQVLIGGDFETVNGTARTGLARLLSEPVTRKAAYDFDGDGKSDISVFRPSDGNWYLLQSAAGFTGIHFGAAADQLAPADYDGDGKTDIAVFRDGTWYLLRSQAGFLAINFGSTGDIPQPGDFTGDGKAELAVFRPSDGGWYKLDLAANSFTAVGFGQNGDRPVVADFDGDGKADPAVYRGGAWYILGSTQGFYGVTFGTATDKPVPADYDGDGKTDPAVFRNGSWYLLTGTSGFSAIQWGVTTDIPVPADYDGDGKADASVFRDGNWYLLRTSAGYLNVSFGSLGDKPIPNVLVQ